jgi:hypothetical protein
MLANAKIIMKEEKEMEEKHLKMQADSLEEARKKISNQVPNGFSVLQEKVISDGKPKTQKGIAETVEAAFNKSIEDVPENATILDKSVLSNPEEKHIVVKALNEKTAKTEAESKVPEGQVVLDAMLKTKGKKGFLGIGRQLDQFEVRLRQNAVVEVKYIQKAEIHAKIGRRPYKFTNRRFYSGKPLSTFLGVILLTPEGEAEKIAKSQVFTGTVGDTVGAYFNDIKKPVIAIGHPKTRMLFDMAASGISNAQENIINTGIESSLKKTRDTFPPKPAKQHYYHVGAMPKNEKTGSPFLVLAVYR